MVSRMGEERTASAQKHMTSLGRAEGIEIKYGGKTGNTKLSHRLLHLAKSKGPQVQTEVALELFRLHFGDERDVTELQMMLDAAKNCGLDVGEVKAYLESGGGAEEVDAEAAAIRASGVKGVPRFRFQGGEHEVDGAGDAMDFFEILMKIKGDPSAS
jgi:predicted DsbA family dithiol-disulfide isomerase